MGAASVLAAQSALLRSLRSEAANSANDELSALRAEVTRRAAKERGLVAELAEAQRQLTAQGTEVKDLRLQLERVSKRSSWELRKTREHATDAAVIAAREAAETQKQQRAELEKQAAQIRKLDAELQTAQAKVRSLRRRLEDEVLRKGQDALLRTVFPQPPETDHPCVSSSQPTVEVARVQMSDTRPKMMRTDDVKAQPEPVTDARITLADQTQGQKAAVEHDALAAPTFSSMLTFTDDPDLMSMQREFVARILVS